MAKASFNNDRVKFYTLLLSKFELFENDQNVYFFWNRNAQFLMITPTMVQIDHFPAGDSLFGKPVTCAGERIPSVHTLFIPSH